jgi:adenosylhomocysteinase
MKIDWADTHMPTLNMIAEVYTREQRFSGLNIGLVLHLEAKTAVLASKIQAAGAHVFVAASNPLTTQDDVVSALTPVVSGIFAKRGESAEEYKDSIRKVLLAKPDFLIDDGADAIALSHTLGVNSVKGACEETTTGIVRVRAMERKRVLRYPVLGVNDAFTKHLFDNRYGTGQSSVDGLLRATNLLIAGKKVLVVGYGWVGKGIAMRLRGLGARVAVSEVDPVKAIEAYMEGFDIMRSIQAVKNADIVVTATGDKHVIGEKHLKAAKEGAIFANAGHFNVEIDMDYLETHSLEKREVRPNVTEYTLPGPHKIYVLADGRLVNLVAADGHPVEVMDLSFSAQFLGLSYLIESHERLPRALVPYPRDLDLKIARAFLHAHKFRLDRLTKEQRGYMRSF